MKPKPGMTYDEIIRGLVKDVRVLRLSVICLSAGMGLLAVVVTGLVLAA